MLLFSSSCSSSSSHSSPSSLKVITKTLHLVMGATVSLKASSSAQIAEVVASQGPEYEMYRKCIIDSGVTGIQLLSAKNSTELNKILLDINIENEEHRKVVSKLLRKTALPPIRLIDFDSFVAHEEFPRYPDQKHLVTELDNIDRNNSFIIFVSHCWLRGKDCCFLLIMWCSI